MRLGTLILLSAWLILCFSWSAAAAEPVDYVKDVKGVMKSRCFACHGALKQEAMLRLDTVALMEKGGESGPVIKAGDLAGSLIISRITHADAAERMPPEGEPPLKPEQIAAIKTWIEQGARGIPGEQPEADPREHWAFKKPVKNPLVIPPGNSSGSPIDILISEQHQRHGLTPLGPAEKHVILRRATLDLTGLPPTREELHTFLADASPDAYERVVDRLLASPSYGERWGRHWMDVWRYSDWYGRRSVPDVMNSYPQIWRWRDWIVRSLNEDKGYDRMVTQMLAADEVCPGEEENLAATGFVVRNWFKWNYDQWMRDQTEHTAKALLGLTLNCALCHDHKYDPISQEEYFRFRAHFEPLELRHDRVPGDADPGNFKKYIYAQSYGPIGSGRIRIFDEKLDANTAMYRGGDQRNKFDKPPVPPGILSILGSDGYDVKPVELPAEAFYPGLREFVQKDEVAKPQADIAAAMMAIEVAKKTVPMMLPAFSEAVAKAEAALAETRAKNANTNVIGPLEGKQSLVLNAVQGRRALSHPVMEFKDVSDKSAVTFLVQILDDGHTNFQLGLDISKGATAGWVGFENGKIVSYKPGGFEQIEVGKYDLAKGENRFRVTLELAPAMEQMKLTVQLLGTNDLLVDHVPVTLKGWNGPRNEQQGIFLDVRPGTAAMYDEFVFRQGDNVQLRFDFEPPLFVAGKDAAGIAGWGTSAACAAPATSLVGVPDSESPEVRAKAQELAAAKQAKAGVELLVTSAEKKLVAAQAEVVAVEARIKADRVRYGLETGNADELALAAAKADRQAKVLQAQANQAAAELALAQASAKPMSDTKRAAEVQAAQAKVTATVAALPAAEAEAKKSDGNYTPLSAVFPKQSTGRRTALAKWITSKENPLTARVAVNHIWQRHFGRGIVETPANFGRNGKLPSNQPLIDSLAVELMDGGWTLKRIHRQIVTSDAYRRSSQIRTTEHPSLAKDAENTYLWRFTPGRMEAEEVRDSVLYLAGELDARMGGKEIEQSEALASHRRSIYLSHHGEARMEFLDLFDVAVPTDCYQRTSSIRPQQALALANSELSVVQSRLLAVGLWKAVPEAAESQRESLFITAAFEQLLARPPTELETAASQRFLTSQRELAKASSDAAAKSRESLVHALLNHNDFVTVR
ncbi:MAG: PSD1 and planctomycete cytochrome C domain-containing protein [Pirellulaceae bacterium]